MPVKRAVLALVLFCACWSKPAAVVSAADAIRAAGVVVACAGVSRQQAIQLALYNAKRRAVELAAPRFIGAEVAAAQPEFIEALLSLAADVVEAKVETVRWQQENRCRRCQLQARVQVLPRHFLAAQSSILAMTQEPSPSLRLEMEPAITPQTSPGYDLARAYSLFAHQHWRRALIYLHRLKDKYQEWGEIYLAAARAYAAVHEPAAAEQARQKACELGILRACEQLHR